MSSRIDTAARALVADGKGILAADETVPTLTRRFDALGIPSTEESRRAHREMLFTARGAAPHLGWRHNARRTPKEADHGHGAV